ncbi:MAG: hypothetical protein AB7G28_08375 [Pirellulales bacterium]
MNASKAESEYDLARRAPGSVAGWCVAIIAAALVGCGGGAKYPHATVTGEVTVSGKPVEQGRVTCFPAGDRGGKVLKADIVDGSFKMTDVPLGTNVFTFSAMAKTGRTIPGPGGTPEDELVNIIPNAYSTAGISREISDDGLQEFKIDGANPQ